MARKLARGGAAGIAVVVAAVAGMLALVFGLPFGGKTDTHTDTPAGAPGPGAASVDSPSAGDALVQTARLPEPPDADKPAATITPAGDIDFEDAALDFEARFPKGTSDDPVIAPLRAEAARLMSARLEAATSDHDRARSEGHDPLQWQVQIKWDYTASAGGIVSLLGEATEFTGGAHPITMLDAHIARAATGEEIRVEDMMIIKRAPSPAMAIAICEGLKAEKVKRIGSATIFDEPIMCAGSAASWIEDGKTVLAPSDKPDRFGGVTVYFAPYAVGAYAEGSYRVTVQQDIFANDLRPDFKPLFEGSAPTT